jgi:hypothetical protein
VRHDGYMTRRRALITASVLIFVAMCLGALAWFLGSLDLDRAAAWSNIFAFPVAIIGVVVGVAGSRTATSPAPLNAPSAADVITSVGQTPIQLGHAGRDSFNVAGGTVNITNHDRP